MELLGIDIARFAAATLVIIWHFAGKPFLTPGTSTIRPLMPIAPATVPPGAELTSIGWIGVQIFFVISGAVIAFSAGGAKSRKLFFISRFVRLWPAMLASACLCSALSILFWHTSVLKQANKLVGSLIFSPVGPWFSGQVWTLPVEIAFYVVVGFVVVAGGTRRLMLTAWCLALLSAAYWMIGVEWPQAFSHWDSHLKAFALLEHGCYFSLGIAIAQASTQGYDGNRLVLIGLTLVTARYEITARATNELGASPYRPGELLPYAVWLIAVLFIIASFSWRDRINAMLSRSATFVRSLGALTYPLYLVHYQTGGPVYAALISRGWSVWGAFLPAYGVAVIAAFAILNYAERPLQRQLKAGWNKLSIPNNRFSVGVGASLPLNATESYP